MPKPDPRKQQEEALARKKALAAKLLLRSSRAQPGRSKLDDQASGLPEATIQEKKPLPDGHVPLESHVNVGLTLRRAEDDQAVRVGRAVERLAARIIASARPNHVEFALLWPGTLRSLSLAHAVCTMSRWHVGDKRGRRTLLYPAKANFLHGLNHLMADRHEVGRLASRLYEPPREVNANVTVSMPEKDAFLASLNSVKEDAGPSLHPTIGELLPHFYSDLEFESWRACDGDLLRNIKARLGDRHHTRSLNDGSIKKLSVPDEAPDALFALGWRTSAEDMELALRRLKRHGSPDAVLIDATRAMRQGNPKWKANITRFLEVMAKVWGDKLPGVCIVGDEPHIRTQLLQELVRRGAKGSEAAVKLATRGIALEGVPCATARDGLLVNGDLESLAPQARPVHVDFTDTKASELIGLFDRLRNNVKRDEWRTRLGEATAFLLRLASLPSSTRVLSAWLDQAGVPMSVREAYTWPTYRARLTVLNADPEFPEKLRLSRLLARADRLWVDYENGTPFARQLAELIEHHTRGIERCCVVFTRPTARVLAERYFQTYDGYPEGAGFEVLEDCVRFTTSNTLAAELGTRGKETVIFAGLDEESLRLLVTDDRISNPSYLLLTRRNAAYLKATLRAIEASGDFDALGVRIRPLLAQLPGFPDLDERLLMSREDFILPTFSFEQALSAAAEEHEDRDPTAWTLVLDSGQAIRRSPAAHAYVYDPLLSHTHTRGYKKVDVAKLEEGQRLFVMSGELRELTEAALKDAGVPISNDKKFEESLRSYHQRIRTAIKDGALGLTISDKARAVRQRMLSEIPVVAAVPEEGTVRSWIDVERLLALAFEQSKPQAPRHEHHFRAFARALGLSDIEAIYFWKAVIRPLRGVRRADGRRIGDAYADMLLEPESMVVHRRLKTAVVNSLFSRARENVYTIEAIKRPFEEANDD